MSDPVEIISDEQIERVHGYANFGGMTKRQVVNDGVLKCAFGYSMGSTQRAILIEHGLVRKMGTHDCVGTLNAKGMRYLRAAYGRHFRKFQDLVEAAECVADNLQPEEARQ